jgi:nicotinamide mononucleotide transporter
MTALIDTLYQEAAALSWVDWTATITALIYVVLAARSNIWCWFWGIISCSLWAYASFAFYDLYLDALLQVFYVVMAVVGWYEWRRGGQSGALAPIRRLPMREHAWILLGGGLLTFLFGSFFEAYTPAAATYWDAGTTVFSVIATFLLVRRALDNWVYWIAVDAVYVGLYASRGAYLFALLMVVYTVIAGVALWRWGRECFRG